MTSVMLSLLDDDLIERIKRPAVILYHVILQKLENFLMMKILK